MHEHQREARDGQPLRGARPAGTADHGRPLSAGPGHRPGRARGPPRPAQLLGGPGDAPAPRDEGARPPRLGRPPPRLPPHRQPGRRAEVGRAPRPHHLLQQLDGDRGRRHAGRRGQAAVQGRARAPRQAGRAGAEERRPSMMRSLASLLAAPPMLGLLTKVTLVLLLGAGAAATLRRASAAARHFVWMLALTGSVALTLTAPIVPSVPLRIAPWTAPASTAGAGEVDRAPAEAGRALPVEPVKSAAAARVSTVSTARGSGASLDAAALLAALYLLGVLAVAGWCAVGHWGLARLLGRAVALTAPEGQGLLGELTLRSGLKAPPRLFRSSAVGSPVTWGFRPVVVLPADADSWPAERRRVVLAHELAHVARGDYLAQLAASVACAVYWFHPLAWVAARRLRSESERAADDLVLARGTPGHEYATHLLDVARRSQLMRPGGMVAIGMARPSHLEGRLLAVLDQARARQALKSRARAAGGGRWE